MTDPDWISAKQVEEQYGIPVMTLKHWRKIKYGPTGAHFGRLVRYRASDWETWAALQAMKAQTP
jgi:hypothetical protein